MTRSIATLLLLLTLAACSGAASSAAPSGPPSSSAPPATGPIPAPTTIATTEDAAARVIELNPDFAGIGPKDPNLIGGCCFWEGSETDGGFSVIVEVGWGDCPSGCIDRHSWTYAVSTDGAVTLVDEAGSPVPSGMPGAGVGGGGGNGGSGGGIVPGGTGIQGRALAGPTCPVVSANDPACADRPLAGVTIIVLTANGTEAARATTDGNGRFVFSLPPGPYTLEPGPAEGILRGSGPIPVVVGDAVVTVDVEYDTGIR